MDCALLLQTLTSCCRFTNLVLRKALRAEILFQKLVLNKKSSLLQVTGSVMLLTRLLQFFGEQVLQHLSQLPDAHANKPPCTELLEDDSELDAQQEEDMEADAEGDREQDQKNQNLTLHTWSMNFSKKGRWWHLNIFYYIHFFIDEVAAIHSEDKAQVNFMEKKRAATRGSYLFRWPQ